MEAKKALEQIKSLLFSDEVATEQSQEVVEVEFAEGVLADGSIVKFDKLEAGGLITLVTPDGEVPAPVGEHELEDGTKIVIVEQGVIAEVEMPEAEVEIEVESEMSVDPGDEQPEEVVIADVQADRFAEISEQFEAKISEVNAKVELLNEVTKKMVEFMDAFAKVETVEKSQAPKNTFIAQASNSKKNAYNKLQNIFQTIKK
jgi:hypothetical protein